MNQRQIKPQKKYFDPDPGAKMNAVPEPGAMGLQIQTTKIFKKLFTFFLGFHAVRKDSSGREGRRGGGTGYTPPPGPSRPEGPPVPALALDGEEAGPATPLHLALAAPVW